ncbi:MAG TPA: ABC transporter substrate-binding protein [Longimicrobiales bacterium]|nr:ABC transporter substrate-binding protein [Longimicrobiales bacterium]
MTSTSTRSTSTRSSEAGDRGASPGAEEPRVVSLIASATEIVCALGLGHRLVGISHECDHPPEVLDLPRLSAPKVDPSLPGAAIDRSVREIVRDGLSVYSVRVDELERLRPDVIVTQDHCEVCAVSLSDVEDALCALDLPDTRVISLHPGDLADVRRDIAEVAAGLGVPERGAALLEDFDRRLAAVAERAARAEPVRVALLEWLSPPMVAGGWMPELARIADAIPLIVDEPGRFSQVDWAGVAAADPDVVVVLPCGFDVARSLGELEDPAVAAGMRAIRAVAEGRCWVVDGNAYFNRPGPRLADSAELLAALLHPGLFPGALERWPGAAARWTPS